MQKEVLRPLVYPQPSGSFRLTAKGGNPPPSRMEACCAPSSLTVGVGAFDDPKPTVRRFLFVKASATVSEGSIREGAGVEVNEELLTEKAHEHGWKNPVWRNHDGTVAEW